MRRKTMHVFRTSGATCSNLVCKNIASSVPQYPQVFSRLFIRLAEFAELTITSSAVRNSSGQRSNDLETGLDMSQDSLVKSTSSYLLLLTGFSKVEKVLLCSGSSNLAVIIITHQDSDLGFQNFLPNEDLQQRAWSAERLRYVGRLSDTMR